MKKKYGCYFKYNLRQVITIFRFYFKYIIKIIMICLTSHVIEKIQSLGKDCG